MSSFNRHTLRVFPLAAFVLGALGLGLPLIHAQTTPFMYVTGRDQQTIDAVSSTGTYSVFVSGPLLQSAEGITRDSAGNLYVSKAPGNGGDAITKVTPAGVMSNYVSFVGDTSPTGLAFDASGNLFVSAQANAFINKVAPDRSVSLFSPPYDSVNRPFDMTFDHLGNLYVASLNRNYISKFAPDGTASVFANMPVNSYPCGLTFDSQDNLYVSFLGLDAIDKITPDGTVSTYFSGSILNYTFDIDMADNGYIYAMTNNNQIVEIAPNGANASVFATLSNLGPANFMVLTSPAVYSSPIPEPSTCAAFAGLAVIGFAALRRRRAVQPSLGLAHHV